MKKEEIILRRRSSGWLYFSFSSLMLQPLLCCWLLRRRRFSSLHQYHTSIQFMFHALSILWMCSMLVVERIYCSRYLWNAKYNTIYIFLSYLQIFISYLSIEGRMMTTIRGWVTYSSILFLDLGKFSSFHSRLENENESEIHFFSPVFMKLGKSMMNNYLKFLHCAAIAVT